MLCDLVKLPRRSRFLASTFMPHSVPDPAVSSTAPTLPLHPCSKINYLWLKQGLPPSRGADEDGDVVRRYVVTMTNPLASGHDGSWGLDLLLECHVGDPTMPSPPPANGDNSGSIAPPEDFGSVSTGGGGGGAVGESTSGGGASASRPSKAPPPTTENINDGGSGASGDAGQGCRGGGDEGQDGSGSRSGIEGVGSEGGRKQGRRGDGGRPVSAFGDDSLVSDDDIEPSDDGDNSNCGGKDTPALQGAFQQVPGAGIDDEVDMVSDDEFSSEDGSVAEARETPQKPADPPTAASPAAAATTQIGNLRSPDSLASLTAESVDHDEGDSSFDEFQQDSGASSEDDMEDDDGYEVDVPYPPCSIMHKSRKTFKHSLCEECYTKYVRA